VVHCCGRCGDVAAGVGLSLFLLFLCQALLFSLLEVLLQMTPCTIGQPPLDGRRFGGCGLHCHGRGARSSTANGDGGWCVRCGRWRGGGGLRWRWRHWESRRPWLWIHSARGQMLWCDRWGRRRRRLQARLFLCWRFGVCGVGFGDGRQSTAPPVIRKRGCLRSQTLRRHALRTCEASLENIGMRAGGQSNVCGPHFRRRRRRRGG
jgi:hypothetical protein